MKKKVGGGSKTKMVTQKDAENKIDIARKQRRRLKENIKQKVTDTQDHKDSSNYLESK